MKTTIFNQINESLKQEGFTIASYDDNRPWGGFFVIDENQAQQFANHYFEGLDVASLKISGKLSPKILLVAPHQRLSWQYHHRRAEIWRLIDGEAGVIRSEDDVQGQLEVLKKGDTITLQQGERHRLVGLQDWGVIAEIWQHTDAENPSDENDIVRVQDDFGR
ncbi:phosphoheptose isomerase [Flavobacterium sp. GSP6]|uniref:phosphoheptose isomerase n=1 Tax=Flavobacterium sp. GSP6 TaxID=2497488 RepID=UPI000F89237E|nr:phosphoheptose isomerase [Flavobacterium sp. GSP6]RTZ06732.1 phosphoheptose isomerase [Flavobacterium sp. GSP6]